MPTTIDPPPLLFTAPERDLIRRSLCIQFSQYPSAAEGILLRTWRGGPSAGEPKVPPAIRTMVERGLMDVRTDGPWPRAHFTEAGWAALRHLAQDRRLLDPVQFRHLRQELGIEIDPDGSGQVGPQYAD
jgi:hypothetical protein